ncbi:MAG: hypothetical protein Q8Q09_01360 [Deltaproteobacteria bacterium]|nr:hypothetical protein [Deltaproteobacteria bacterium]
MSDAEPTDASRVRRSSYVWVIDRGSQNRQHALGVRLVSRSAEQQSVDMDVDGCRVFDPFLLDQVNGGTVTAVHGENQIVNSFIPSVSRYASNAVGRRAMPGEMWSVSAPGTDQFPGFSLSVTVPPSMQLSLPPPGITVPFDARTPLRIAWPVEGATDEDEVLAIVRGSSESSRDNLAAWCFAPYRSGNLTFSPAILARFDRALVLRWVEVRRVRRTWFADPEVPLFFMANFDGARQAGFAFR